MSLRSQTVAAALFCAGDVLRLSGIPGANDDLFVWAKKPWRRIG